MESGKWPLGLSDFYHNYLISNDCIQHSSTLERYPFATPKGAVIKFDRDPGGREPTGV